MRVPLSCRVHGNSQSQLQITDRSTLPGDVPPKVVNSWRPALEQRIISPTTREFLEPIIIRPGSVFGGASPDLSVWFQPLLGAIGNGQNEFEIMERKNAFIATVHKDDLAEAYRLIIEKVLYIYQNRFDLLKSRPVFVALSNVLSCLRCCEPRC